VVKVCENEQRVPSHLRARARTETSHGHPGERTRWHTRHRLSLRKLQSHRGLPRLANADTGTPAAPAAERHAPELRSGVAQAAHGAFVSALPDAAGPLAPSLRATFGGYTTPGVETALLGAEFGKWGRRRTRNGRVSTRLLLEI